VTRTPTHKKHWRCYRKKARDYFEAGYTVFLIVLDNSYGKALKPKIKEMCEDWAKPIQNAA
jgi:hypothetical protein